MLHFINSDDDKKNVRSDSHIIDICSDLGIDQEVHIDENEESDADRNNNETFGISVEQYNSDNMQIDILSEQMDVEYNDSDYYMTIDELNTDTNNNNNDE